MGRYTYLLQTYKSEYHVAGAPADAENKGEVAAGVLSSLRYQCSNIIHLFDLTLYSR